MAYKTHSSVLPVISIFVVLLALGQAVAGRNVPTSSNKDDKKQPEWLLGHDGSFFIPGIGPVVFPPLHNVAPYSPFPGTGSTGGSGSGAGPSTSHEYVPHGDDTYAPNPGYEVPTAGNGGGNVPAPSP